MSDSTDGQELPTGPEGRRLTVTATDVAGCDHSVLRSALALAARGWHVFPCAPGGKRPALRGNWQHLATADLAQLRSWWARGPYNVGVACGPSGLVVIDLDISHGDAGMRPGDPATSGASALVALCDRHGQRYPLPTYAVDTPSGGCHLYYATAGRTVRNSAGRLGPLIDIRADGGYVIGDGSRIGGSIYTARDQRPPAPLPGWIGALLDDGPAAPVSGRTVSLPDGAQGPAYAIAALRDETRLVAVAVPGTRNDTLNRAAFSLGQLAAAGLLPPLTVETALSEAAERAGLPEGEARRTIRSGMTAGARKPRQVTGIGLPVTSK
jgi:hypothetical protein